MPAIATYEEIRDYPFFDECAEESWSDTDSYFNQVAESRQAYHHPPHTLKVRSRETSRVLLFPSRNTNTQHSLEQEFDGLIKIWVSAVKYKSLESQQINHPAFLRIIAIGEKVLPSVFAEFSKRPFMAWFKALPAIVGQDVASEAQTFPEAVELWIEWAKAHGYLKSD